MFILESPVLMFIISTLVLIFVINPAVGWYVCGIVDSYIGKSKGYGRYATIGFALMFSVLLLYIGIALIMSATGNPMLPF